MTQVRFLHGAANRHHAAASWLARRLADTTAGATATVLVLLPDDAALAQFDRLLWTHEALSFVPHCRSDSELAGQTPVLLTQNLDSLSGGPCLLNLTDAIPDGFSRFDELVELLSNDTVEREAGRARYKHYRAHGYPLATQDFNSDSPS